MSNSKIKSDKFILRLRSLIEDLRENSRDLVIHRRIDQFYYMQKEVQLKELSTQCDDAIRKLESLHKSLEQEYRLVYRQWRKDIRWMHRYRSDMKQQQKEKQCTEELKRSML